MKAVMLMFDSLNRHLLPAYDPQTWVHAPNFRRLAERCATFETSYVCSMPCMPARRDFHTGRPNFLHTGWGPLEPYDDSVVEMLRARGVYTHLASDHYHYWEDGGATYHTRYDTWQFFRGQEGDPHVGQVADPPVPENANGKSRREDWVNRQHQRLEHQQPQGMTIEAGLDFLDRNHAEDDWFLQIECFDPHEPFVSNRHYEDLYASPDDVNTPLFDWPPYERVSEPPELVDQAKRRYAALVSKCDRSLGEILDRMDAYGLWEETLFTVWTDHGFMLGEHGCWAKNWMPLYEEVAHTPFFLWDPRHPEAAGARRRGLVQPAIDLGPTLLGFFGIDPTATMLGHDLEPLLARDEPVREAAIFGYHGNRVNVTDGRHVYLRDPVTTDNGPCYQYTLMPTRMRGFRDLDGTELAGPFSFTRAMPLLKIGRGTTGEVRADPDHLLFDLAADPGQADPLEDPETEARLAGIMRALMEACDAPAEQYQRMGLEPPPPAGG